MAEMYNNHECVANLKKLIIVQRHSRHEDYCNGEFHYLLSQSSNHFV